MGLKYADLCKNCGKHKTKDASGICAVCRRKSGNPGFAPDIVRPVTGEDGCFIPAKPLFAGGYGSILRHSR